MNIKGFIQNLKTKFQRESTVLQSKISEIEKHISEAKLTVYIYNTDKTAEFKISTDTLNNLRAEIDNIKYEVELNKGNIDLARYRFSNEVSFSIKELQFLYLFIKQYIDQLNTKLEEEVKKINTMNKSEISKYEGFKKIKINFDQNSLYLL